MGNCIIICKSDKKNQDENRIAGTWQFDFFYIKQNNNNTHDLVLIMFIENIRLYLNDENVHYLRKLFFIYILFMKYKEFFFFLKYLLEQNKKCFILLDSINSKSKSKQELKSSQQTALSNKPSQPKKLSKPDLDLLKLNDLKIETKKKEEEGSADSYLSFEKDEKNKIKNNEQKSD